MLSSEPSASRNLFAVQYQPSRQTNLLNSGSQGPSEPVPGPPFRHRVTLCTTCLFRSMLQFFSAWCLAIPSAWPSHPSSLLCLARSHLLQEFYTFLSIFSFPIRLIKKQRYLYSERSGGGHPTRVIKLSRPIVEQPHCSWPFLVMCPSYFPVIPCASLSS